MGRLAGEKHGLGARDTGIDLVAKTPSGRLVAIQCKAYSTGNVTPSEIQKFRGTAPKPFDEHWMVAMGDPTRPRARH